MATLDEIEAMARAHAATATLPGGYVQMDVVRLSDALLGLVAHVRALEEKLMLERAALDKTNERIGIEELGRRQEIDIHGERIAALERKTESLTGFAVKDVERIASLEAKAAALAGPVIPVDLSEIHAELDRLRAENAELRKRVEAGAWPAPQPIETAPLGRTVFWYSIAFKEWRCFAVTAEDMDEVRAGYSHWIPMPPPPGGGE